MKSLVVNLFAGPGAGKSTLASWLFSQLKLRGESAELVTEYAKEKVWADETNALKDQFYVSAKQYHRIWKVYRKVKFIITDSPLLLGLIYGEYLPSFSRFLLDTHDCMNTYNILVHRSKPYVPNGRLQTASEARECDEKIMTLLWDNKIPFHHFYDYGDEEGHRILMHQIMNHYDCGDLYADPTA